MTHERPKCRYQARDAAGVRPLTFHGLRHTAASLLIRKMDIQIVKTIMGHASIKTTERYRHAVRASDLVDKAPEALAHGPLSEEDRLLEHLNSLEPEALTRVLESVGARPGIGRAIARAVMPLRSRAACGALAKRGASVTASPDRCPKHAYENHQNQDFRNQTWGR